MPDKPVEKKDVWNLKLNLNHPLTLPGYRV
jgi:hypothetical protein